MQEEPAKASEWLIALAEAPRDAGLRARFERWLAADPLHARDWKEINRTYEVLGLMASPARPARRPLRRLVFAAGAVAAAACFALLFLPRLDGNATGLAERREIRLADGSLVQLAPDSAISVAFDERTRHVRLVKGGAFFQVAHETRLFTVQAGTIEATDVGTAYEVKLGSGVTRVAVREGLVEVGQQRLAAGEWLEVDKTGKTVRGSTDPRDVAAWTDGQLIVKNQPVEEVVAALRPYFAGAILVRSETLGRKSVTGVYNLSDPRNALQALAQAQGATVRSFSPWLLILSDS